jgi:hypothetical protein
VTPIATVTAVPHDPAPATASPPAAPSRAARTDFSALVAVPVAPQDGAAALRAARARAPESPGEAFEAAMLVPFVAAMLPPEDSEIWGGTGGAMWRGLFADALAADVARAGGIGLAGMVDRTIAAHTDPTTKDGDPA